MASLFTRTLRTTCRRRSPGFLSSSPTCFKYRPCTGRFETSYQHEERNTPRFKSPKTTYYSTWCLAAAGICSFSSAMLVETSSCPSLEEADKESGHVQPNGVTNPKVVFVLGGPGSGKGTQCAKIVKNFGFTHLSAGDLLRAEIRSGSEYGAMINNTIKEGKIVPSEVTVKLLQKAMKESGNDKFLIDGFPRNEENRAAFETITGIEPEFVIFFDCTEEEMERRLMNRNQGRVDDNIDTIKKRFNVFVESSLPVVEFYKEKGKLRKINAMRDIDDVFKSLKPLFTPFVEEDILQLTKELLQCIDNGDYGIYERLCDPALTAFEPESQGHLVEGLSFHKFYFNIERRFPALSSQSSISSPRITLVGEDVALVTYTRLCQSRTADGVPFVEAFNETRVWERKADSAGLLVWRHVHFHRSKSPLHRSPCKTKKGLRTAMDAKKEL